MPDKTPLKPGYYWAKWRIPADGTHEGTDICPSDTWEIVQVNPNVLGWEDDPKEDEALSVSVPGIRETQWRDCFVWGDFVSPIDKPRTRSFDELGAFLQKRGLFPLKKNQTDMARAWRSGQIDDQEFLNRLKVLPCPIPPRTPMPSGAN